MDKIFFVSIFWIIYTYFLYPLILMGLVKFKRNDIKMDNEFNPFVTIIIAAYNEELSIKDKIENSLKLDYPKDKLEIIIASDASTDKTDDIVRSFSGKGFFLVRQLERRGKTAAQNCAVNSARGEILVFSDATTVLKKDAVKKLVRNFKDKAVGCVGGQERFITSEGKIFQEASFFWKYELFLRKNESQLYSAIGVSGCIFAIKRELYEKLDDSLIEDFALPLNLIRKGFRVLYEEEAIAYEHAAMDTKGEFSRKARIVSGGINVLWRMKDVLNPFRYPLLSFQLFSHKICRWVAPFFLIILLNVNLIIFYKSWFFMLIGLLQIAFYSVALIAYFLRNRLKMPRILKVSYHFCIINFSAVWGILKFLRGERKAIWNPVR